MENYFILLGLSFDPVESNEEVIKNAIDAKREQWQKEAKNPRKQIQAKENIAKIPEIEKVMLNPSERKLEAEKAFKSVQKHVSNLKNEILLLSVKGNIEETEFNDLVEKYKDYSISKEKIMSLITVPIGDNEEDIELPVIVSIPKDIASQLEMYFNNLGYDDMSIYNFYNISSYSSSDEVINTAQLKLKEMLEKGTKDNKDEIEQKISGIIINLFKNHKEEYDNYLKGCRYFKLNELIKTAIIKNKRLNVRVFDVLFKIIKDEYNFSNGEICDYIISNCSINDFDVSQDVLMRISDVKKEKEEEPVKEIIPEIFPEESPQETINTTEIINQMLNPINTLLINNKNKINQMAAYLKQYKENREEAGAAMSPFLSYGSFGIFGLLTAIDLFFLFTKAIPLGNMLSIILIVAGIGINVFGTMTIYPAFSQWSNMVNCVYNSKKNNDEQDKLYDSFIQLNFNLLIDDNKTIIDNLNQIKEKSNILFKNTTNEYEKYTRLSKKYQQKEYYGKNILVSILVHALILVYILLVL